MRDMDATVLKESAGSGSSRVIVDNERRDMDATVLKDSDGSGSPRVAVDDTECDTRIVVAADHNDDNVGKRLRW